MLLCAANNYDMKVKYEAKKRTRINYCFMGFTTFEQGWWFNYNTNKWEQNPKAGEKGYSSYQRCNSVKSFETTTIPFPKDKLEGKAKAEISIKLTCFPTNAL